ncbi:TetR/AcrR family transcriptional regulator [Nocardiopsis nanhaiensis]
MRAESSAPPRNCFYEKGITSAGVDLIAARSGVTKRTLDNRFGAKDALVATYLFDRDQRWRELVEQFVCAGPTPAGHLIAPFKAFGEWTSELPRGCAVINALAELPDLDHPVHRVAFEQNKQGSSNEACWPISPSVSMRASGHADHRT